MCFCLIVCRPWPRDDEGSGVTSEADRTDNARMGGWPGGLGKRHKGRAKGSQSAHVHFKHHAASPMVSVLSNS